MSEKKIEEVRTCPLGSVCEEIKDNKIHRCHWYIGVTGSYEVDGKEVDEERFSCAIAWLPALQLEMSKTNRGQTSALESFRNETVKRQDDMINEAEDTLTILSKYVNSLNIDNKEELDNLLISLYNESLTMETL